jgi:hypothetical protein
MNVHDGNGARRFLHRYHHTAGNRCYRSDEIGRRRGEPMRHHPAVGQSGSVNTGSIKGNPLRQVGNQGANKANVIDGVNY